MRNNYRKKELRQSELDNINQITERRSDLVNEFGYYFGNTRHTFDSEILDRPKNKLNPNYLDQFK